MRILIIDGNNLQHRAMHAYSGLTNNVKPVSIIYGMVLLTNHMIKQFKPERVYVCWDTARHKKRLELLPGYKGKRSRHLRTPEEYAAIEEQRKAVMKLYNGLNVWQLYGPGMEADDWIYMLTLKHEGDKIVIVSSDKDFNQLLTSKLTIWNPNKSLLIHKGNVRGHFGYSENECVDYLSLVGDSSDNIPGYRGMGEETTKIFLAQHGSIKRFLENKQLEFRKIDRAKLEEVYKRNRLLIGLKAFYNKYLKNHEFAFYSKKPTFDKSLLISTCREYNIKTFLKKGFTKQFKQLK